MRAEIVEETLFSMGIKPEDCKLIGGYSGNVFEVDGEYSAILKILDRSEVDEAGLLAEMEWLHYLHSAGVKVARPLRVDGNAFIRHIGNEHYCVMYEKLIGQAVSPADPKLWNPATFRQWGETMGQIHAAAARYGGHQGLPQWYGNSVYHAVQSADINSRIIEKWEQYRREFAALPVAGDSYGLIHGDMHHGNLLAGEDSLYVIDFGDSEHHWFAYDIAIAIYHSGQTAAAGDREHFTAEFCKAFMQGYKQSHSTVPSLEEIGYFIEYRHLYSFIYHCLYADKSSLSPAQLRYLEDMESSVLSGRPYVTGFS
ncbi:phosphotransferase enzyme family protein [Paenibacillus tepidiphilus]|uniref:phosphotransferase enzyme family protein n=1 Tax=Paenibacillus tepidiphilus TaxID=2608683 RepID=UPI0012393141|nr:phosphotransferase [Paenibacillus tepidiphilus]